MQENDYKTLGNILELSVRYCALVQEQQCEDRPAFIRELCITLAGIYGAFLSFDPEVEEDFFVQPHADEELYEYVRAGMARIMGGDDVYLETFEEDMKYSETPIGATVSESLADIFQPLYDFAEECRLSEGATIAEAYSVCRYAFTEYWSQTLTNVLRPLNALMINK